MQIIEKECRLCGQPGPDFSHQKGSENHPSFTYLSDSFCENRNFSQSKILEKSFIKNEVWKDERRKLGHGGFGQVFVFPWHDIQQAAYKVVPIIAPSSTMMA